MLTSDMLLRIVARLRHDPSVVRGRRLLLEMLRKGTGARLCLLFRVDQESQVLRLLGHSGRRPPLAGRRGQARPPRRVDTERIPLHGAFGAALHSPEPLYIPDIVRDPRSLREEQYWGCPDCRFVVSAVGARDAPQGVLALCFGTEAEESEAEQTTDIAALGTESNFMICVTLLSTYLSEPESEQGEAEGLFKENATLDVQDYGVADAERQALIAEERRRIARELHDGIVQDVTHVIHKLELSQRLLEEEPQLVVRELQRAQELLRRSLQDLRYGLLAHLPERDEAENTGLEMALRGLLAEYTADQPEVKLVLSLERSDMVPATLETPIFRLVQEALNNARKYAHASEISVRIYACDSLLLAQVKDNGIGFRQPQFANGVGRRWPHFGLRAMRERIQLSGGGLEVQSRPGEGTCITARFPLVAPPNSLTSREREVLRLLIEGSTNRTIAKQLSVSIETVKSHVHHIMQKMQVKDRTQAAVLATKQRWV